VPYLKSRWKEPLKRAVREKDGVPAVLRGKRKAKGKGKRKLTLTALKRLSNGHAPLHAHEPQVVRDPVESR
jgi:hypothetical protein